MIAHPYQYFEWDDGEKALELIFALKDGVAEILETISASCRNSYNDLTMALQRKFGDEHKRELYRMDLRWGAQKSNKLFKPLQWKSRD